MRALLAAFIIVAACFGAPTAQAGGKDCVGYSVNGHGGNVCSPPTPWTGWASGGNCQDVPPASLTVCVTFTFYSP